MAQLNANIPYIEAFVRNNYLFNDENNKELTPCYIFGVKTIINRPLLFHCQLQNGVVWWSLPLSAFVWKEDFDILADSEEERLSLLQYWDCQSNDVSVTVFTYLQNYIVDVFNRNKDWYRGKYLFTIDDYYSDNNSLPSGYAIDSNTKCYHIIKLDNGNFGAYPNNYLRWNNLNFCDPYDKNNPPKYRTFSKDLNSELIKKNN
jgi:hypothetical protein